MKNLVIIGMPGAGKGTQSAFICGHFGIPHISTGDMLRKAVSEGTPLGLKAAEFMNAGKFVPDETVLEIVAWRLSDKDCANGFLLDGYPRNRAQAESLDGILAERGLAIDRVIELRVAPEEVVRRLSSRKVCPKCSKIYSGDVDLCSCGERLIVRDDDREEVILERIRTYNEQTAVLVDYYSEKGLLLTLESLGGETPEEVWKKLRGLL